MYVCRFHVGTLGNSLNISTRTPTLALTPAPALNCAVWGPVIQFLFTPLFFSDKIGQMKKIYSALFLTFIFAPALGDWARWWEMPTICRPSNTMCYTEALMNRGGFMVEEWDTGANCRGKKIICPNAVVGGTVSGLEEAFSRAEIVAAGFISTDFDIDTLDSAGGCFGIRRLRGGGTEARVDGQWVNVFCPGILDDPDVERVGVGEIIADLTAQPNCEDLSEFGFLGVLRSVSGGQCFGMPGFPPGDFYLDCGNALAPERIIVLNGADRFNVRTNVDPVTSPHPLSEEQAAIVFERMIANAEEQRRAFASRDER